MTGKGNFLGSRLRGNDGHERPGRCRLYRCLKLIYNFVREQRFLRFLTPDVPHPPVRDVQDTGAFVSHRVREARRQGNERRAVSRGCRVPGREAVRGDCGKDVIHLAGGGGHIRGILPRQRVHDLCDEVLPRPGQGRTARDAPGD